MTSPEQDTAARQAADFVRQSARQEQFLSIASRDEAETRFRSHLTLAPLGEEIVSLAQCRGRVLARDLAAAVDVPGFDRSNVDGFAVVAANGERVRPDAPRRLRLHQEVLTPGWVPRETISSGIATIIATGGMIPRGADAVVMVERTEFVDGEEGAAVDVSQPLAPGAAISAAGSDIRGHGETVHCASEPSSGRGGRAAGGDRCERSSDLPASARRCSLDGRRVGAARRCHPCRTGV